MASLDPVAHHEFPIAGRRSDVRRFGRVDEIVLVSDSGKPMKQESDLIDVWFDSGSMPYAQVHYPFENKELIDNGKAYPADFIAEASAMALKC